MPNKNGRSEEAIGV